MGNEETPGDLTPSFSNGSDVAATTSPSSSENAGTEALSIGRAVRRFANVGAVVSAFVGGATVMQAVTSYYQLTVMREQTAAMVDQLGIMRVEQRPWVKVGAVEISIAPDQSRIECVHELENVGKTACNIRIIKATMHIADNEPLINEYVATAASLMTEKLSGVSLAPGQKTQFRLGGVNKDFNVQAAADGVTTLIVAMQIDYADSFGELGQTTCYYRYNAKSALISYIHNHNEMK